MSPANAAVSAEGRPGWAGLVEDLPREHGFEPLRVEGRLPDDLIGTLYRNGPAQFSLFGERYLHLFDGDGALSAVRFEGGNRASGAARLVHGKALLDEQRRGKRIYASFMTPRASLFRRQRAGDKNTANTGVMIWNGKLYALVDSGMPTELCAEDLSTIGESDLDGVVVQRLSVHPRRIASRGASFCFGLHFGRKSGADLYTLPDAGPARHLGFVPFAPSFVHDGIVTQNHFIFFVSPVRLNVFKMLLGMGSFGQNLRWRPEQGTEIVVVSLDRPDEVSRFTVPPFFLFHFANAFERRGELVVDYVRFDDFSVNDALTGLVRQKVQRFDQRLFRAVIDLRHKTFRSEPLSDVPCEFPRIAPAATGQEYRHAFVSEFSPSGWVTGIACIHVQTGTARRCGHGPGQFGSEPVFVRKPQGIDELDGYLLPYVYDSKTHTTHVAIFDAARIEDGPVAKVHFDHHIPLTFHGAFNRTPG